MRASLSLAALSAVFVGQVIGQNAEAVNDNPVGVSYKATFPKEPFFKDAALDGNVEGYVSATAAKDGKGVQFSVKLSNLPKEGGPFKYHLHAFPVPADGNCTQTLAHLDPYKRTDDPACDSSKPESCEVGDLSGKWGEVKSDPFDASYIDLYASTKEGIGAFFGNRSIVIHYANKTRLTCANFAKLSGNDTSSSPGNASYTPPPQSTGAAPTSSGSGGGSSTETPVPSSASSKMLPVSFALAGTIAALAML